MKLKCNQKWIVNTKSNRILIKLKKFKSTSLKFIIFLCYSLCVSVICFYMLYNMCNMFFYILLWYVCTIYWCVWCFNGLKYVKYVFNIFIYYDMCVVYFHVLCDIWRYFYIEIILQGSSIVSLVMLKFYRVSFVAFSKTAKWH